MNHEYYSEKLAWFKDNEKPDVILLLEINPWLTSITTTWPNIDIKFVSKFSPIAGDSDKEVWEWLWENTRYNILELKQKTGYPFSLLSLDSKLKVLVGNRMIYPDGTVNSFVQRYLREKVLKLFEASSKRGKTKS